MSQYRRVYLPGASYFFTVVTYRRIPWFNTPDSITLFGAALRHVMTTRPFEVEAIVVLPDHLHCLWRLPEGDGDFSGRWREVKKRVSRGIAPHGNARRERRVWQRRFWEHLIRDEEDWRRHVDYIHFNPVKHGLAAHPAQWRWSSFRRAVAKGWYPADWGNAEPAAIAEMLRE
ncbi:MAG: transposase [Alphaproteobacteria bacterium CG_4_10_14_0_2_um_filter_63_37]|nr:MAG: transposase [Proteobacteria bacterium CG1_02_64_396]PJA23795.1 MAG: transposase [Alphaproteobacteria bacterium CG_4_10_14_0_2_um_filter_63_37]